MVPTNDLLQLVLLLTRLLQFEIVFYDTKAPISNEAVEKRFAMLINIIQVSFLFHIGRGQLRS